MLLYFALVHQNGTYRPNALTRSTCQRSFLTPPHEDKVLVFVQPDNMCYCPCCPFEWLDYVLHAQGTWVR